MWNLLTETSNVTYARQQTLYSQIRKHNRYHYTTNGNDVQGWAWALRYYTDEPYKARSFTSKTTAIRAIVEAIDRTGHPVGITVHHGTHAWVVLGYKAQPSATDPTKRTILGLLRQRPARTRLQGPVEVPLHVDGVVPQGLRQVPRARPARSSGKTSTSSSATDPGVIARAAAP